MVEQVTNKDIMALKNRIERLEKRNSQLEATLKTEREKRLNTEDMTDEQRMVNEYLSNRDKELEAREAELQKLQQAVDERSASQVEVRQEWAGLLAEKYQVKPEALLATKAQDRAGLEEEAKKLQAAATATTPAGAPTSTVSVQPVTPGTGQYEHGTPAVIKRDIWHLSDKEFDDHVTTLRQEAIAKKRGA